MGDVTLEEIQKHLNQLEERVCHLEKERASSIGITIEDLKLKMQSPPERSAELIEWALSIVGIGEGPEDLARNFRAYLHGERG